MKKLGLVILLMVSSSAFGLDSVPVSEIRAKLCPVDRWYGNQESILWSCSHSNGSLNVRPGEAVVFGFLMQGSDICYLPCDFLRFYGSEEN